MINNKLYFKVLGKGFPLLMLHGNGEDHTSLIQLAHQLKTDFKVYLIDAVGHGKSQGNIANTYDDMGSDLIGFLNKEHINNCHVLGYSDGAIVALKALLRNPQNFNKLIFCGLNISPDGLLDNIVHNLKEAFKKEKNPLLKLMLEGPHFDDLKLEKINHHIRLYFGDNDVIKHKHQLKIHRLLSYSTLHILPHETHESYIMHNDMLSEDILAFLNNTESS